jgi:hypothetical protein
MLDGNVASGAQLPLSNAETAARYRDRRLGVKGTKHHVQYFINT